MANDILAAGLGRAVSETKNSKIRYTQIVYVVTHLNLTFCRHLSLRESGALRDS